MIFFLMFIVALVLFIVSYFLLAKQQVFFTLIQKNEQNETFLHLYGLLHAFLGILAIFIAFFDHKTITLIYLAFMLLISASFSLLFSKKMNKTRE